MTLGNPAVAAAGRLVALPLLSEAERLLALIDHDPQRLIVNFHLLFNVALAVSLLARPGRWQGCAKRYCLAQHAGESQITPRHLDTAALPTPTLALANAARASCASATVSSRC
ncbi:hypothetical protein ACTMU2_36715 [Cupriavidus basilensis]